MAHKSARRKLLLGIEERRRVHHHNAPFKAGVAKPLHQNKTRLLENKRISSRNMEIIEKHGVDHDVLLQRVTGHGMPFIDIFERPVNPIHLVMLDLIVI